MGSNKETSNNTQGENEPLLQSDFSVLLYSLAFSEDRGRTCRVNDGNCDHGFSALCISSLQTLIPAYGYFDWSLPVITVWLSVSSTSTEMNVGMYVERLNLRFSEDFLASPRLVGQVHDVMHLFLREYFRKKCASSSLNQKVLMNKVSFIISCLRTFLEKRSCTPAIFTDWASAQKMKIVRKLLSHMNLKELLVMRTLNKNCNAYIMDQISWKIKQRFDLDNHFPLALVKMCSFSEMLITQDKKSSLFASLELHVQIAFTDQSNGGIVESFLYVCCQYISSLYCSVRTPYPHLFFQAFGDFHWPKLKTLEFRTFVNVPTQNLQHDKAFIRSLFRSAPKLKKVILYNNDHRKPATFQSYLLGQFFSSQSNMFSQNGPFRFHLDYLVLDGLSRVDTEALKYLYQAQGQSLVHLTLYFVSPSEMDMARIFPLKLYMPKLKTIKFKIHKKTKDEMETETDIWNPSLAFAAHCPALEYIEIEGTVKSRDWDLFAPIFHALPIPQLSLKKIFMPSYTNNIDVIPHDVMQILKILFPNLQHVNDISV